MEFVFVVPRVALFPERYPHGLVRFAATAHGPIDSALAPRKGPASGPASTRLDFDRLDLAAFEAVVACEGFFVERAHAERTPMLKQIIPYSIVVCGDRVLLTKRMKTGGESRLHEKYSIGIGGHINPEDAGRDASGARDVIDSGTRREIAEELAVSGEYKIRRVGLLNDDSNAVGAVHVGVVQVIHADAPVEIREREQLEGRLVRIDDLRQLIDTGADIETWSQLLIPHLDELLPARLAVFS
jgi:predicted NUDIX family phosphoesterase